MMLGNRKPQINGQNWFIVLHSLKSEIERNKIAKEIAKCFRIPVDEALDLVANTPIILLENLRYTTALQIKQYFRAATSDLIVSNDSVLKRRCFRTVWPTPPSLTFLKEIDIRDLPKIEEEKLGQDEAIQEIRSWVQTDNGFTEGESLQNGNHAGAMHSERHFKALLEEERERLLKENVGLKESLSHLHKALEKIQTEQRSNHKVLETAQSEKIQKEKEVQELQILLGHAEEKYEILREEFRQTRQYFEEKLMTHEKKAEEFLRQIEDRDQVHKEILEEKQALQKSLYNVKNEILRSRDEQEQTEREWQERGAGVLRELETQKKIAAELQAKIATLEEGKKIVQSSETRLIQELESQTQQTKRWETKVSEMEKEIVRLRESFENQTHSWQLRLAQLESREHELEKARKQVRDLQQQLEHRELIQRKRELAETLAVRESQLKNLVKQQEKLEIEIRHRDEELRKLLQEQETLEREVIEIKQAQRHLAERTKKEGLDQPAHDPLASSDLFSERPLPELPHD